jgi:hypothetical protein
MADSHAPLVMMNQIFVYLRDHLLISTACRCGIIKSVLRRFQWGLLPAISLITTISAALGQIPLNSPPSIRSEAPVIHFAAGDTK